MLVDVALHLKEEFSWVTDKWLQTVSNPMLFKTDISLRKYKIKPF